jgi:hypothetical protein
MAKTSVFVASRTEQENYLLLKKLESLEFEFKDVKLASVHTAGLVMSVDRLTAAVILNLNEWTPKEAIMIQELRRVGYVSPILVTAKADPVVVNKDLRLMNDVVFLPKPSDVKDLLGIMRKLLLTREVPQQKHRRFPTQQDAELEIEATGGRMVTRVRNLSKGGAYLEFLTPSPLKVGEFVKVKLELKDLQRVYTLPAKVVWSNRHGSRGLGIGVEFTGRGDVQRSILGY